MASHTIQRAICSSGVVLALTLAGCGGGGSATPGAVALTGLAATGAGIAGGAVTARCASGPELSGTTDGSGVFTLSLGGGQVLPCMLKVSGGTPSVTLYSFAQAQGRVNITPATDLLVARALGVDPDTKFATFDAANGKTIEDNLVVAKTYVNNQLNAIVGASFGQDLLSGVFSVGDTDDKVLDAFGAALTDANKTVADLRAPALANTSLSTSVPPFLGAPNNPSATTNSASQITLTWAAVPGATSYKVYRATISGTVDVGGTAIATSTAPTWVDTGLSASTAYFYKVVAANVVVVSAGSAEVVATTGAANGGGAQALTTWTPHNTGAGWFDNVLWDGSKFVALGSYVGTSTDGASWTLNALIEGKGLAKSGNTLLLAGINIATGSDIRKSVDGGTTWTKPATANIFTVTGNAHMFVGIGGGAEVGAGHAMVVKSTTDGETWTTRYTESVPNSQTRVTSFKPIWNGTTWLISAFKYDPTITTDFYDMYEFFVLTSTDGTHWTKTVVTKYKANYTQPWWVVWSGSEFVMVDKAKTLKSSNGTNWSSVTTSDFNPNTFDFVGWTGSEFVAFSGGGSSVKVWTSPDAITWTARTTTATQPIYGGVSNGTTYVAVGNQLTFTSP